MNVLSTSNFLLIPILAKIIVNIDKKEETELKINPKNIKKSNLSVTLTS